MNSPLNGGAARFPPEGRLYPILDAAALEAAGLPGRDFAARAAAAAAVLCRFHERTGLLFAVQIRGKNRPRSERAAAARAVRDLLQALPVPPPLFVNDDADAAAEAGADGVHLGEGDEPVASVRRRHPDLLAGRSTHNLDQVAAALRGAPDLLAFGPVFPTANKERPDPVAGLPALAAAAARVRAEAAGIPLVAIGGVTPERVSSLRAAGADAFAAIGSFFPPAGGLRGLAEALDRFEEALSAVVR